MKKYLMIFTMLFFTFLLIGCGEEQKEVVEASDSDIETEEIDSMKDEIVEYTHRFATVYKELGNLSKRSINPSGEERTKYLNLLEDAIFDLETLNLKPITEADRDVYEQFVKLELEISYMYNWATEYVNKGGKTYKKLFNESHDDVRTQYDILVKFMDKLYNGN